MFRKALERVSLIGKRSLIGCISLYQYLISPVLGQNCRFFPSCSEYAKESIQRFGVIVGTLLVIWRLCRCAPWSEGGIDRVPEKR